MAERKTIKKVSRSQVSIKPAVEEKELNCSVFNRIRKSKFFILLIIIVVAAILFYFKGLFIAAIVNGMPISRFVVTSELEKTNGKQILSSLVAKTLITQEAQKRKISVVQKEIDDAVKKIEDSLTSQGQNLDQALAMQGMTRSDFVGQVKIQKLIEKMFSKDVKVTDKEISDYIEQNKASIPSTLTGDALNTNVKQQLEQQKLSTVFQTWLTNAQKNAKIMYFVNF